MFDVSGNAVFRSWPLYCILMIKVAMSPAAPTVLAAPVVLDGSSLTLGRRELIPSLEHVTFSVPTLTPMIAAIRSQVSPPRFRFRPRCLLITHLSPSSANFSWTSSGHTFGGTCLSAKCEGQVYVAYACRYLTGRKLLVEDVILRLRYVAAVSTRRMQVKSACPFRNSASEFCRTVGASPRRRAVAQLRRGPRLAVLRR
jgi:hypothetical protein